MGKLILKQAKNDTYTYAISFAVFGTLKMETILYTHD